MMILCDVHLHFCLGNSREQVNIWGALRDQLQDMYYLVIVGFGETIQCPSEGL